MPLYPEPEGYHCLNCRHCVRVIRSRQVVGNIPLIETRHTQETAPIRCRMGYWGQLDDGRDKMYRSPWVAEKSVVLRRIAERCPDLDTEP